MVFRSSSGLFFWINFHAYLHFLVTESGVDEADLFHKIPRFDDPRLTKFFTSEVLADFVRKELLCPEWAEHLLPWRQTEFNVYSWIRAKTTREAERVGKYMIRLLLSLERLSLIGRKGKVCHNRAFVAERPPSVSYRLSGSPDGCRAPH